MVEIVIIALRIFQGVLVLVGTFLLGFVLILCFYLIRGRVPWVPTQREQARALLEMAGLKKGEHVLDLGCGDGRILITAARDFGATGIGYDINVALLILARLRTFKARVPRLVRFRRGDLFKIAIPRADVVVLYLYESVNAKLLPRLRESLPKGTRVVTRAFPITALTPIATQTYGKETHYLYEL